MTKATLAFVAVSLSLSMAHAASPLMRADPVGTLRLPGARQASFLGHQPWPVPTGASPQDLTALHAQNARAFILESNARQDVELKHTVSQAGDGGVLASYFVQSLRGVPIEGTYAIAVSRDGALHYARQRLVAPPAVDTRPSISIAAAQLSALRATRGEVAVAAQRDGEPVRLVIIYVGHTPRLAWRVELDTQRPWQRRAAYVDAHAGQYLTYKKLSAEAVGGRVSFEVERECVGDTPKLSSMPHVRWSGHCNAADYTDEAGEFTAPNTLRTARVSLKSPYVELVDERRSSLAGPWTYPLAPMPMDNSIEIKGAPLDQVDPFYHVHTVRAWVRAHVATPNNQTAWSDGSLQVHVNISDTCNAYYDGGLHFFSEGDGCMNTGRTADVVYHEYGHGIHEHSPPVEAGLDNDGQIGEGISDYVAATLTGNPNMRGVYACDDNFRTCDNTLTYCDGDCDMGPNSELHDAGQVICGVWWELRAKLVERYGDRAGVNAADRLFLRFLELVGDMESAYQATVAADSDADADPTNGTDHSCEINQAFKAHFPDLHDMVPCQAN